MKMELPETHLESSDLILDEPETKGSSQPPAALSKRLAVGSPLCLPLTAERLQGDPDLLAYVRQSKARFHYVRFSCGFRAGDDPFDRVWVEFALSQDEGPAPIAWSMAPLELSDKVESTTSDVIGAKLKFDPGELSAVRTKTQKSERRDIYLEAIGEGESTPCWEFRRTHAFEIAGTHRLVMIIQSAVVGRARAALSIRARVEKKALGVFSYRANLPPSIPQQFELA